MQRLNKLDDGARHISHRFLGFLEDRLAPLTLMVLVAVLALSFLFWDWLRGDESGSTTIRNLGLVIAAIVALPLAIWRSKVAERQAATAQRQSETAQRGLLNERYQKGAEMLGNDLLAVRLGGIYAMASLAREHPADYHTQIMRLLCAFARNPMEPQFLGMREDVKAILTAIRERSEVQIEREKQENYRLDLSGANLEGANLNGANLDGVDLFGANLKSATLGWKIEKEHAFLASLVPRGANLNDAILHITRLDGALLGNCEGLTQEQLDGAVADKDNPPILAGALDANTGKPLVWRDKSASE